LTTATLCYYQVGRNMLNRDSSNYIW